MATSLYKNVTTEQLHSSNSRPVFADWQSITDCDHSETSNENISHQDATQQYPANYPQIMDSALKKYPVVITTLGHFSIYKNGQLSTSNNNCQHKPAELLKLLIALGSRSVGEVRINDALWPDSDGDIAHTSFSVTLHRTRKYLTIPAIQLVDGHLTLNDKECWVDVWELEKTMNKIKSLNHSKNFTLGEISSLANIATQLYQGHFLGYEDEQPWFIAFREKLKTRFARCLAQICDIFEQHGQCHLAIEYYRKGIEIDQLCEEFYQRLMKCYMQQGRYIEAAAVFQQCQKISKALTGIEPSAATYALFHKASRKAA